MGRVSRSSPAAKRSSKGPSSSRAGQFSVDRQDSNQLRNGDADVRSGDREMLLVKLPAAIHELEFAHGSLYGAEEQEALLEVLRANAPSCGPWVKRFEDAFANYCGAKYGLAVTSGTTGLQLAMIAAGIGPGDEVITTPISWIATANA